MYQCGTDCELKIIVKNLLVFASMLANCSSSIEPIFNLAYSKNTTIGTMYEVNQAFMEIANYYGIYDDELIEQIASKGTARGLVPTEFEELFRTANEIDPAFHVKMQAAFQKHVDNGISKTVNLPNYASVEDVKDIFMLAYDLKCKSTTVYRDGSRAIQAIDTKKDAEKEKRWEQYINENCTSGTCSL